MAGKRVACVGAAVAVLVAASGGARAEFVEQSTEENGGHRVGAEWFSGDLDGEWSRTRIESFGWERPEDEGFYLYIGISDRVCDQNSCWDTSSSFSSQDQGTVSFDSSPAGYPSYSRAFTVSGEFQSWDGSTCEVDVTVVVDEVKQRSWPVSEFPHVVVTPEGQVGSFARASTNWVSVERHPSGNIEMERGSHWSEFTDVYSGSSEGHVCHRAGTMQDPVRVDWETGRSTTEQTTIAPPKP